MILVQHLLVPSILYLFVKYSFNREYNWYYMNF